jgi:2-oxoglutarate ferredoxin oxidoreductase subunit gamma
VRKRTEIRFGGLGGQGIVLAAQVLGRGAVWEGKEVLQSQAYGAESRGSLTKSEVIISESKIGYPAVRSCDILVVMSQEASDALCPELKETGTIVVDSTQVKEFQTRAKVLRYPITEIARRDFGDAMYANMVMLGILIGLTGLVGVAAMEEAIAHGTPGKSTKTNIEAFRDGLQLAQNQSTVQTI